MKKQKIHLLLHLVDNMLDFGPMSAFCTERWGEFKNNATLNFYRCESYFNGYIRKLNVYSNRQCISRDIATKTAVSEQLAHICSGAYLENDGFQ